MLLSVAQPLIESMTPDGVLEFNRLISLFVEQPEIRRETIAELLEWVRTSAMPRKIKAAELLGVLHIQEAEPILAEAFTRTFPPEELKFLQEAKVKTNDDCIFLVKNLTALVFIDRAKWGPTVESVAAQFAGSWVGASLNAILNPATPAR